MGATDHRILQARIPDRVAFPFSRGSSQPRDQTQVCYIAGRLFTSWATKPKKLLNVLKPNIYFWQNSQQIRIRHKSPQANNISPMIRQRDKLLLQEGLVSEIYIKKGN